MDSTATTTWGPASVGLQGVIVSGNATLSWATTAATSFYFRWRGVFQICGGGTVNVGTSGARIPSGSTAVLEMSCAANNDSKLLPLAGGTLNIYGATKTTSTRLTVDAAAAATNLTVGSTTGWLAADRLAFSPTGASASQHETKNVLTNNSATTLTLSAGLTNAHSGTSPIQGYVLNMTRNIKFQSDSSSNRGNLYIPAAGGNAIIDSCEFVLDTIGSNSTNNRPIDLQMTTNSVTMTDCAGTPGTFGTGSNIFALYINNQTGTGNVNNFTITRFVCYNWLSSHIQFDVTTTGTNWTITGCVCLQSTDNINQICINDTGGTVTNNVSLCAQTNSSDAFLFREGNSGTFIMLDPTKFDGNVAGYSGRAGISIATGVASGTGCAFACQNLICFRNAQDGFIIRQYSNRILVDNLLSFGNGNSNPQRGAIKFGVPGAYLRLTNSTLAGDSTIASAAGIRAADDNSNGGGGMLIEMYNTTIGVATGIFTAFTTADIVIPYVNQDIVQVVANKCKFGSSLTFQNLTDAAQQILGDHVDNAGSYLRSQMHNQVAGDHRTFASQGNVQIDTTVFHTASPSTKCTPNTASFKLRSGPKHFQINSGSTKTINVWTRKSSAASGDSANYNGSQQRLIARRNDSIGITADTVLATAAAAIGTWEQLTGTTVSATSDGIVEVYLDGDGTTGFFSVDDWS